jgi:hypothetical protein
MRFSLTPPRHFLRQTISNRFRVETKEKNYEEAKNALKSGRKCREKLFLITRRLALHLFLPTEFLSDRFCLPFRALNESSSMRRRKTFSSWQEI